MVINKTSSCKLNLSPTYSLSSLSSTPYTYPFTCTTKITFPKNMLLLIQHIQINMLSYHLIQLLKQQNQHHFLISFWKNNHRVKSFWITKRKNLLLKWLSYIPICQYATTTEQRILTIQQNFLYLKIENTLVSTYFQFICTMYISFWKWQQEPCFLIRNQHTCWHCYDIQ